MKKSFRWFAGLFAVSLLSISSYALSEDLRDAPVRLIDPKIPENVEGAASILLNDTASLIRLNEARSAFGYTGSGYTVAIVDTGIDYNHPGLGGGFGAGKRVIAGFDFANNDSDPMDDHGHGTHVAGIVGSSSSSLKGVAPDCNFVALKVLKSDGTGEGTATENALKWIITNRTKYNIVTVNMSLGFGATPFSSSHSDFLDDEFSTLKSANVS
ncbi:MAG: S8 family serine peptidase, partial [Bdellovibrionales bacterium]|nr:S8 family serine peptidase [Bdellovibrionales bacterium]